MKKGFSYATVIGNVAELHKTLPIERARAAAFAFARVCYFQKFPQGALPEWLARPHNYRLREHYDAHGHALHDKFRSNPRANSSTPRVRATQKEMREARELYEGFTGRPARGGRVIKLPPHPRAGVVIGTLIQVGYRSERDGQLYRHTFRASSSRPLLIASSDGKQALIVGGRFVITDRGIEDR